MNRGLWGSQLEPRLASWIKGRIASFDLFTGIPPEDIDMIVERGFFLDAGPGKVVTFKGTMYGEVYLLLDGSASEEGARIQVGDSPHDFSWIKRILLPGDTFGELPGKLQHPQPYTVVIREKGNVSHNVMILPPDLLGDILERHPGFATRLYRENVAARLRTIPALQNISPLDLRYLSLMIREERFARGTELPRRPSETNCLWIVNQGRIAAFEFPEKGPKAHPGPDHYISAGQVFVLDESPVGEPLRLYKAVMETDASLYRMPFEVLESLYERMPRARDFSSSLEYVDPARELAKISADRKGACRLDLGFDKLSPQFLKLLSGYMGWEYVPQWEDVVVQGERANKLYVLRKGEALRKATDRNGRERPRSYIPDPVFRKCHFGLRALLYTDEWDETVETTSMGGAEWFSLAHEDFEQLGRDLKGELREEYKRWRKILVAAENLDGENKPADGDTTSALGWLARRNFGKVFEEVRKSFLPDAKYCYDKIDLSPGETPEFCRRKHWWIYFKKVVGYSSPINLTVILMLLLWWRLQGGELTDLRGLEEPFLVAASLMLILSLLVAFLVSRDFLNDFLVVTNRRVVARDQVLLLGFIPAREISQEIPIQQVQDVKTFTVGVVRRMLDVGNIYIQSAATSGTITFENVGHPNAVRERILKISMRTQRLKIAKYKELLKRDIKENVLNLLAPVAPSTALPHRPLVPRPVKKSRLGRFLQSVRDRIGAIRRGFEQALAYLIYRRPAPYTSARQSRPMARKVKWRHMCFKISWEEGDRIYWRKHWIRLYRTVAMPVLLFVLLVAAAILTYKYNPFHMSRWHVLGVSVILILLDSLFFFVRCQNWSNDLYILDRTVLHDIQRGVLSVSVKDVITPLSRIQNVDVSIEGLEAKMLGYGTIRVSTAAQRGEASFDYIPHPYEVRDMIMRRIWALAEAQEQRRAAEDRKRLTATVSLYEELKEKSRPSPPRVWHKPYRSEESDEE